MSKRIISRVGALALSVAMAATTMAGMNTYVAEAAITPNTVTVTGVTADPADFKAGDTINLTFTVNDTKQKNGVTKGATVTYTGTGSDFTGTAVATVTSVVNPGVEVRSKYTIGISGVKAEKDSTEKSTLGSVKVEDNTVAGSPYIQTIGGIELKAKGEVAPPDTGSKPTDTRYSLLSVYGSAAGDVKDTYKPGRRYYDIEDFNSSSDATIRQSYFASVTVRISDANAPAGMTVENIVPSTTAKQEMGSFLFDRASTSTIEMVTSDAGFYEITFKNLRYSGNGKKLSFRVKSGTFLSDLSFEIGECMTRQEAANANKPGTGEVEKPAIDGVTPYVIVSKYGYGGAGSVTAGETFTMSVTLYNTSETEVVDNMMVTVTMPEALMMTSSSNTFYIPTLEKQSSITKTMQVTAKVDAKPLSHNVGVAMKYQYIDHKAEVRRSAETNENIAIPVVQVDRFQLTSVEIASDIMLEEESSVTASFVNKGRSEVYNVSVMIDGNIQNPGQNQNLGNLASGATGTADFFIKPNEAGTVAGTITVTYEDTNMEEKTTTIPYNATVKTMEEMNGDFGNGNMVVGPGGMVPGMGEGELPVDEAKKPIWPIVVIVGVAVLIPVAIIVIRLVRKKRREREDADL